jgi:hypothetical protein
LINEFRKVGAKPAAKQPAAWRAWSALKTALVDDLWGKWIPEFVTDANPNKENFRFLSRINKRLSVPPPPALLAGGYKHRESGSFGPFQCRNGASKAENPDPDARRAFVKPFVEDHPLSKSSYPLHKRFGFEDVNEMVNGYDWWAQGFHPKQLGQPKQSDMWFGYRHLHYLSLPITDAAGKLIYNYVSFERPNESQFHLDSRLSDATFFSTAKAP